MKTLLALTALLTGCATVSSFEPLRWRVESPYPYVGSLYHNLEFTCTVELVDSTTFITAAHCMDWPGTYMVRFDGEQGAMHVVAEYSVHPEWRGGIWYHDLAIGRLQSPSLAEPVPLRREPVPMDTQAEAVSRVSGRLNSEEQWIIGQLCGTDLLLWSDAARMARPGISGGALVLDGELVGVHSIMQKDGAWQMGGSTSIAENWGWLSEQLGLESGPGRLPELPVPGVDESAPAP